MPDDYIELELDLPPHEQPPRPLPSLEYERALHRIADLEKRLATIDGDGKVATVTAEPPGEEHGYRCGWHPKIWVSQTTTRVECAVCHAPLEAHDILRQCSRKERHFAYDLEHLREEAKQLRAEVVELKRVRANLRAQIKRATSSNG